MKKDDIVINIGANLSSSIKKFETELEFLRQSNYIEGEYSDEAFAGACTAWSFVIDQGDKFDVKDIIEVHRLLLEKLNPRIAGKYRNCKVWIAGVGKANIGPEALEAKVAEWFKDHWGAKTEEGIKQAHIEFEFIHPFEDGNGRVGRILYNWQRLEAGLPIHVIHVGKEQSEYYKWFKD